jgi:hypothetical protein
MTRTLGRGRSVVEASALGLSYGAALCWGSVCLLASFRPDGLSAPYWSGLPDLRSDTTGIAAFATLAVTSGPVLAEEPPVSGPASPCAVPGSQDQPGAQRSTQ